MSKTEIVEFIEGEKKRAESELKFREESVECWSGGTSADWKKAGCRMTKEQRLETSARHGRIAIRCRRRVELLNAVLSALLEPEKIVS